MNKYIKSNNFDESIKDLADSLNKVAKDSCKAIKYYSEVVIFDEASKIASYWSELADKAIEPNPFYTKNYLFPLVENILQNDDHYIVLIWSDQTRQELLGLFPITKKGKKNGYPFQITTFLFDDFIGICTPLISPQAPKEVWKCFFKAIEAEKGLSSFIYIPEFYSDGATGNSLKKFLNSEIKIKQHIRAFNRAVAIPKTGLEFKDYMSSWSSKKRRNMRSREKKLNALGDLSYDIITSTDPEYPAVLASIMELEQMGWKGQQGTALLSQKATENFAKKAFKSTTTVTTPDTHLAILRLDGRIIAGQINLIFQNSAFFIKSAYDETLSSFGPGLLLYKWVLQKMIDENIYAELDSCANADHVLEDIWLERKRVEEMVITPNTKYYEWQLKAFSSWLISAIFLKGEIKNFINKIRA